MEILITSLALFTLAVIAILIGTRGRPMRFFTAFGETMWLTWTNRKPLILISLTVFVLLAFLFLFYATPGSRIYPEQPIPFSHQLHSGVKAIDCYYCHPQVGRSLHPGLPAVEKCLHCHNYIIANHPQILKEHAYYDSNTPTPWVKVNELAEHVLFNHMRHIRKEIACESCHGEVRQMDRLQGKRFYMGFCIECHRERKVNLGCWLACHS